MTYFMQKAAVVTMDPGITGENSRDDRANSQDERDYSENLHLVFLALPQDEGDERRDKQDARQDERDYRTKGPLLGIKAAVVTRVVIIQAKKKTSYPGNPEDGTTRITSLWPTTAPLYISSD